MIYYTLTKTPAGTLFLTAHNAVVTGIYWNTPQIQPDWIEDVSPFKQLISELTEYFAGTRQKFSIKYAFSGTEFQKDVWRELEKIPYRTTTTYQTIATTIGRPKAVRAVGTAIGHNPLSIVIPCHRVIATSGKLGGYGGGIPTKIILLELEKAN